MDISTFTTGEFDAELADLINSYRDRGIYAHDIIGILEMHKLGIYRKVIQSWEAASDGE